MAKTQEALLQEVVGLLRKQNQLSTRDRLRESEEAKQAQKLATTEETQTQNQSTIISSGQDFQRRFLAGQAKTFTDQKVTNKILGKDRPMTFKQGHLDYKIQSSILHALGKDGGIAKSLMFIGEQLGISNDIAITQAKSEDQYRLMQQRMALEDKREADAKLRLTGPTSGGRSPLSGLQNMAASPGSWVGKAAGLIPLLAGWAVGSLVLGIKDFVYGYDSSGLTGGIAGLLGGADEGGFVNSVRNAFKGAGYGATIGLAGGLPGVIIGGMIGMGVGALLGWIGASKIEDFMDENISEPWNEMTNWFKMKHREISRWIFTPPVTMGPHSRGGMLFGSELLFKLRFFDDWSGLWDDIGDYFKTKYDTLSAWIFTAPTEDGKGKLFGSELLFDLRFWRTEDGRWNDTFAKIGEKLAGWGDAAGEWLYSVDGTKVSMFGGFATMPTWSSVQSGFKSKWDSMWETIFNIPNNIMSMIKSLFPARVREWLGWNDDIPVTGTPVGQVAAMAMANQGISLAQRSSDRATESGEFIVNRTIGGGNNVMDMLNLKQDIMDSQQFRDEIRMQQRQVVERPATIIDNTSKTSVTIMHSQEKVVFGVYPPSLLPSNPMLWHPNGSLAQ